VARSRHAAKVPGPHGRWLPGCGRNSRAGDDL